MVLYTIGQLSCVSRLLQNGKFSLNPVLNNINFILINKWEFLWDSFTPGIQDEYAG